MNLIETLVKGTETMSQRVEKLKKASETELLTCSNGLSNDNFDAKHRITEVTKVFASLKI